MAAAAWPADLDGNGATDLYVTTAGYDVARDAYDALLWNDGDGPVHGRRLDAPGSESPGGTPASPSPMSNGDGRLDVFVSGYTDVNAPIPGSRVGLPC